MSGVESWLIERLLLRLFSWFCFRVAFELIEDPVTLDYVIRLEYVGQYVGIGELK